jgi:hypothetical protein
MLIRHIIFFIFVDSALYVYFRVRVDFSLVRSLMIFRVLLRPINTLLSPQRTGQKTEGQTPQHLLHQ